MKESIQMESEEAKKNTAASHSDRFLNTENLIHELKDKL